MELQQNLRAVVTMTVVCWTGVKEERLKAMVTVEVLQKNEMDKDQERLNHGRNNNIEYNLLRRAKML